MTEARVVLVFVIPALAAACGDGSAACVEGRTLECPCPGRTTGTQQCTSEGTFSPCLCGDMDASVPDSSVTDATAGDADASSTDAAPDTRRVDTGPRICATDSDCTDGDSCTLDHCNEATRLCEYPPMDGDGDGDPAAACGGADCDDSNPDVYAGADEICNGLDDDCSSGGGNDPAEDRDDDGFVDLDATCTGGDRPATDCDDTNADTYPGATEICDGADNDCDGATDEDANVDCLISGTFRTCVSGTCVFGSCRMGYEDCNGARGDGCEVNLQMDDANCGACGNVCASGLSCCSGSCVDTTSSADDCGMCGNSCSWTSDCCRAGTCVCGSSGLPCRAGQICYGSSGCR